MRPPTCRASEIGSPGLRHTRIVVEERRGSPRLLGRPLRTCRGRPPRRSTPPPRPLYGERRCCLQGQSTPWASREGQVSGPHPHGPLVRLPTHRRRHCWDRRKAGYRPAGLSFGRAGFAPAGRQTEFHEVIASSLPFGPALPGRTELGFIPIAVTETLRTIAFMRREDLSDTPSQAGTWSKEADNTMPSELLPYTPTATALTTFSPPRVAAQEEPGGTYGPTSTYCVPPPKQHGNSLCARVETSLVGISHACDYPPGVTSLPRLTTPSSSKPGERHTLDREAAVVQAGLSIYRLDWIRRALCSQT